MFALNDRFNVVRAGSVPQFTMDSSLKTVFLDREYVCERDSPIRSTATVVEVIKSALKHVICRQ